MALDPDDPRPPYVQVASALRAAILTKTLEPGDKLPSGSQLAERYGVARMTVQQAIRVLREEGLVVSRQGSGVFVRERTARPVGVRPVIERAFQRPHVSIDFFGFTAETLLGALQEPLDKIRAGGAAPDSIAIRMLLPDTSHPMPLPCRVDGLADDPEFRERSRAMMQRHTQAITDGVAELDELGLIGNGGCRAFAFTASSHSSSSTSSTATSCSSASTPSFAASSSSTTAPHEIYDLMGKDATLFHHTTNDDSASAGSLYVEQMAGWFDTIWTTVAKQATP